MATAYMINGPIVLKTKNGLRTIAFTSGTKGDLYHEEVVEVNPIDPRIVPLTSHLLHQKNFEKFLSAHPTESVRTETDIIGPERMENEGGKVSDSPHHSEFPDVNDLTPSVQEHLAKKYIQDWPGRSAEAVYANQVSKPEENMDSFIAGRIKNELQSHHEASIIEALVAAAVHAEQVSRRDHIKADRIERVNQFIVSIRRELNRHCSGGTVPQSLLIDIETSLTRKETWDDILVQGPTLSFNFRIDKTQFLNWVSAARLKKSHLPTVKSSIEDDLAGLQRIVTGTDSILADMAKINDQGEVVAADLRKLFA